MSDKLADLVERSVSIADKRNLARENPITLLIDVIGSNVPYYLVVSDLEPNHVTLPMNVTWIVTDESSPDYGKALRRVSGSPFDSYRNTWAELRTYEDFVEEIQFWDVSANFQVGEVEISKVQEATIETRGLFTLNLESETPGIPVVVADSDPRMFDDRYPTAHVHPELPATMLEGNADDFYVTISQGSSPEYGQLLVITGKGDEPNEWLGYWRDIESSDFEYDGPVFTHLVINGTDTNEVNELNPIPLTADAYFSDGSKILSVNASWSIVENGHVGSISSSTGVFRSNDIEEDTPVSIKATWLHPASNVENDVTYVLDVLDVEVPVELISLYLEAESSSIDEDTSTVLTLKASFDNGTVSNVIPTSFSTSNKLAGVIDSSGLFTAASNVDSDQLTIINADYEYRGTTFSTTESITVVDTTVYPISAIIQGSSEVEENTDNNYIMTVTYSDGTVSDVVGDWSISDDRMGIISSEGTLSVSSLDTDTYVQINSSFTMNGKTVLASKSIKGLDMSIYPVSAAIIGPASINESSSELYELRVTFSDGSIVYKTGTSWRSFNTDVPINTLGYLQVGDIDSDTFTDLTVSYTSNGHTIEATKRVTVIDTTNYPVSAEIISDVSINESSSGIATYRVTYKDGTTSIVTPTWNSSNDILSIDNEGAMAVGEVTADIDITISATYSELGIELNESKLIKVVDTTNYPVSAVILGPVTVSEGNIATYGLEVTYSDDTVKVEDVTTFTSSNASAGAMLTSGKLTTPINVDTNIVTRLSASYTFNGRIVSADLDITVTDSTVYPASLEILGADSLNESESSTYTAKVTYTDNTSQVVSLSTWTSSVSSAGTISQTGTFVVSSQLQENVTTQISATHTLKGISVTGTKLVTVTDTTNYPKSAVLLGSTTVDSGSSNTYVMRVTYNDGSVVDETIDTWASSNADAGSINTSGVFTSTDNNTGSNINTTISSTYTYEGTQVSASMPVSVKSVPIPVSMSIVGLTNVYEDAVAEYSVDIAYSDGTTVNSIEGSWASSNADAGTMNTSGTFTSNSVTVNTNTLISCTHEVLGIPLSASKEITVTNTKNLPVSATILGVDAITEGNTATYQFRVTYDDSTTDIVSVSNWASSNVNAGSINTSGVFTSNNVDSDTTTSITVSYIEHGVTVSSTLPITVSAILPVSANITGPASVVELKSATYSLTVTFSDASTKTVDVTTWAFSNSAVGGIVSSTGVFTAFSVPADTTGNISASYSDGGTTVNATKSITVSNQTDVASGLPRWGYGPYVGPAQDQSGFNGPQSLIDSLTNFADNINDGFEFDETREDNANWTYFAIPASLGSALFFDKGSSTTGGWDGATWLDDFSTISNSGPATVRYDDGSGESDWLLYRTDWEGPSSFATSWSVSYTNN